MEGRPRPPLCDFPIRPISPKDKKFFKFEAPAGPGSRQHQHQHQHHRHHRTAAHMVYKNIASSVARIHTSAAVLARSRLPTNIKLRNPIVPTINNLQTPDDHPLYQFFSEKRLLRSETEIAVKGRPWTVQELRRKSFEDLHCLWYVVVKERNVLSREARIVNTESQRMGSAYSDAIRKMEDTLKNIRRVLIERSNAQEKAQALFSENRDAYLEEFTSDYLGSGNVETEEWFDKLERLQFAFFGIPDEISMDLEINVDYVLGIRYIGNLVFQKFKTDATPIQELRDITEHYAIFEEEPTLQGFQNGLSKIEEYRLSEVSIPKNKDITVVQALIRSRIEQAEAVEA